MGSFRFRAVQAVRVVTESEHALGAAWAASAENMTAPNIAAHRPVAVVPIARLPIVYVFKLARNCDVLAPCGKGGRR